MVQKKIALRIDSATTLEKILKNEYLPQNNADKEIMQQLDRWMQVANNSIIEYIYFGSEFCEYRIPKKNEWNEVANLCMLYHKTLSIVIPPLSVRTEKTIINLIQEILTKYKELKVEVVVNDFGALEQLNRIAISNDISIRLGRVLDKTFHDSRLNEKDIIDIFGNAKYKWFDGLPWLSTMLKNIYRRYHVEGCDIDVPSVFSTIPSDISVDGYSFGIFIPYSYSTTGGICQMKNMDLSPISKFDAAQNFCTKKCCNYYELLEKSDSTLKGYYVGQGKRAYRIGNTIFYLREDIEPEMIFDCKWVDRIILSPKLML